MQRQLHHLLGEVYKSLINRYGPQFWWPGDSRIEVVVGAILVQATSWRNAEKAILSLKRAKVLDAKSLGVIREAHLAKLIYSSGFYRAKAKRIKAFSEHLWVNYKSDLDLMLGQEPLTLRRELLTINGIGEETADCILLYAAGWPMFIIDEYTMRIVDRLGIGPKSGTYADYQQLFEGCLTRDVAIFNEYHALLVALGQDVCRKQPQCVRCVLASICIYGIKVLTKPIKGSY